MTYSIAQACSQGSISSCGCDPAKRSGKSTATQQQQQPASAKALRRSNRNSSPAAAAAAPPSGWKWGGCSADIRSGSSLAKRFADSRETEGDARSLMNLHNNKAGRKARLIFYSGRKHIINQKFRFFFPSDCQTDAPEGMQVPWSERKLLAQNLLGKASAIPRHWQRADGIVRDIFNSG